MFLVEGANQSRDRVEIESLMDRTEPSPKPSPTLPVALAGVAETAMAAATASDAPMVPMILRIVFPRLG
jgi:hypothetical protein